MQDDKPTCRVERWRGYVTSTFVLRTPDGGVFESRPYRWRKAADPPDAGDARHAYDELTAELEAAGWEVVGHGDAWYAAELTHASLAVALPEPEPEPPAARPAPAPAVEPRAVRPPAPPAPVVVPAEAAPRPSPAPPARRRRRRPLLVAGAVAVTAVAGVAAGTMLGPGRPAAAPPPSVQRHPHHARARTPATTAATTTAPPIVAVAAPPPRPARVVHVAIEATGDGSWVEVRRRSKTGPVLFAGVLEPGRTLRFSGSRLWARFGAAGNLRITQDGRPVALQGTYDKVFRQSRR